MITQKNRYKERTLWAQTASYHIKKVDRYLDKWEIKLSNIMSYINRNEKMYGIEKDIEIYGNVEQLMKEINFVKHDKEAFKKLGKFSLNKQIGVFNE